MVKGFTAGLECLELIPVGAALEKSLRKNIFKTIFFSVQSCRYGVSYEYSSRQILKKIILSCLKGVF
jgi:hypothetical protein